MKLYLNAIDAVDTVDEQDGNEDERDLVIGLVLSWAEHGQIEASVAYLETILQLRYQGVLGDEIEQHALPCEGHWDDQ